MRKVACNGWEMEEDTSFPFTSPHSPSSSAWAYPPGCYGPVARLKHRASKAAKPASSLGQSHLSLAAEDISTSRRKHVVVTVTPPSNPWLDNEDSQPCWSGQDQFYRAGLPTRSQLSPGRMQQLLRPRARTSTPHSTSPPPPTACHPGV